MTKAPALAFLVLAGFSVLAEGAAPQPVALTHVTVIDTRDGSTAPDMTVVIDGNHIVSVHKSLQGQLPGNTQVIDGTDKYVMPGLWDMHTHFAAGGNLSQDFSLYLANGVTGIRDTGTIGDQSVAEIEVQAQVRVPGSTAVQPRVISAGRIIDGVPPYDKNWSINVGTAEQARAAVRESKRSGSDFIKVYSYLSREAYFALMAEAEEQQITVVGHVPYSVSAAEASDAGQKSLEHADGVLLAASSDEQRLRSRIVEASQQPDASLFQKWLLYFMDAHHDPSLSYSPDRASALFSRFVRNGTWMCPTLVTLKEVAVPEQRVQARELSARYVPDSTQDAWRQESEALTWSAEDRIRLAATYKTMLNLIGDMRRAGVRILAGTDVVVPHVLPGFSLHEELALLVEAGLTPLEAIQSATIEPARFLGLENDLGTVEAGKLANLVVLDANPVEDIRRIGSIDSVFVNGQYLGRGTLKRLLSEVVAGK